MGRNSAFDHAGNVGIALVAGAVGYAFSQRAVFLLVPFFALLTVIAVLSIPAKAIDPRPGKGPGARARRGGGPAQGRWLRHPVGIPAAGHLRPLRHAVPSRQCAAAAARRAEARCRKSRRGDGHDVGLHRRRTAGHAADRPPCRIQGRHWGRKPLFLAGFAILPIRAALYTLSDNSFWLVGVQCSTASAPGFSVR